VLLKREFAQRAPFGLFVGSIVERNVLPILIITDRPSVYVV